MDSEPAANNKQIRDCFLRVDDETLAASTIYGASSHAPHVISYHGFGATATRARIRYALDYLAQHDISSACFDFSGNGDSTGKLEEANLRRRYREAQAATAHLITSGPVSLIGTSMGGFLAALLAPVLRPRHLILFCPPAYPEDAMDLPLNGRFGALARRPGAYARSPAFKALQTFEGSLLIFAARNDPVIVPEVIEAYLASAPCARRRKVVWLRESGHKMHLWLADHPRERELVLKRLLDVLTE